MRLGLALALVAFVFLPTDAAEGFYRVDQRGARWCLIDPEGRKTFLRGVGHVCYRGVYTYMHGTPFGHYERWNDGHYPSRAAWHKETAARLRRWGFNALGGGSDDEMRAFGFAYMTNLKFSQGLTVGTGNNATGAGKEGLWICPHAGAPCTEFPNVFHPDFTAFCRRVAQEKCAPFKNDRNLVGYFTDNELAWWGRGAKATGLFDAALALPTNHTARLAAEAFARERGVDIAEIPISVKRDFLALAAEKYFAAVASAIRAADSNHLVLGARFAGLEVNDDVVWAAAGRHCDVLTVNCYPWADLARNVVLTRRVGGTRVADELLRLSRLAARPVYVTEWSFPALDTPCPSTCGGGMRVRTQRERAQASELMVRTLLASPAVVGSNYFMWVDEPPEGISTLYREDANYGLVSEKGEPYAELTEMFTRLHGEVDRGTPIAPPKEVRVGETAAAFARRHGLVAAKGFVRDGGAWTWTNSVGFSLSGSLGRGPLVRHATLHGRELGEIGAMVKVLVGGKSDWIRVDRVTALSFVNGAVAFTLATLNTLELDGRLVLDENRPEYLLEVASVRNVGTRPLALRSIYLTQRSPFAREKVHGPHRPSTWGDELFTGWRARDGRVFGVTTTAPDVESFSYYVDASGVHPDAAFVPEDLPRAIAAGTSYLPQGKVWVLGRSSVNMSERQTTCATSENEVNHLWRLQNLGRDALRPVRSRDRARRFQNIELVR